MSKQNTLHQLLTHPSLWQASSQVSSRLVESTGHDSLDRQLHDGGWPKGALTELLLERFGIGEIRLFVPFLARKSHESGFIAWINPPWHLNAPALQHLGINLDKVLIIHTQHQSETFWASQQALSSGACVCVLTWLPTQSPFKQEIRKLSLAARQGACWGIIFRHEKNKIYPSSAQLRIHLKAPKKHRSPLSIIKQMGGWSGQELHLNLLPEREHWCALAGRYWPSPINHSTIRSEKVNSEVRCRDISSDNLTSNPGINPTHLSSSALSPEQVNTEKNTHSSLSSRALSNKPAPNQSTRSDSVVSQTKKHSIPSTHRRAH